MNWNRLAAVLTGSTAAAHLGLAITGFGAAPVPSLILVAMGAWCLVCAKHLWKSGSARTCLLAAGGGFAMIALHVAMMTAPAQPSGGHHDHHATAQTTSTAAPAFPMMDFAMAVGVIAEVVLIGLVAVAMRRKRLDLLSPG